MRDLGKFGASSLSPDEVERLCEIAEESARNYIMSKLSWREISDLNIAVEAGGREDLTIEVEIELRLSPLLKEVDAKELAQESVEAAFGTVEKFLREDRRHSRE